MSAKSPLVDDVRSIEPEKQRGRSRSKGRAPAALLVHFASGTVARLDPTNARHRTWSEVLESLRETKEPAYIEIDPETSYITSLLLPQPFAVTGLRDAPELGAVEIELEISHARHYLKRDHPRFVELKKLLEAARRAKTRVLVTEDLDGASIVDARPAPASGSGRRHKT